MALSFPGPFEILFLLILMGGIALTVFFVVRRRSVVQRGFDVYVKDKPNVASREEDRGREGLKNQ